MSMELFKKQVYSGLAEIIKDDKFYYHSQWGVRHCELTEKGKEAVIEYVTMMGSIIMEKEKKELEKLAKEMTWKELKK